MIEHSGACSTLSLSGMLSRHFPLIRILRAVHSILQQSVSPGYHLTSGSTSSGSVSVSSDDLEQQSETRAEFMSLITMDSALYMYRLAESFVEGSTSFMILAAGSEVEFRSITEESQSSSLSPVVYITGRHNRHRDMWLDVDNMSYEELLALEDRIGYVSTGLSEEEIIKFLKPRKYFLLAAENAQKESCSICQEDYIEDDELGTLDCSHGFHVTCIHQWLRCKNICPICKSTGLQTNGPSYYI